ncbi:MAG: response regulator transcription factor [Actinobacteria bacterium]|nr:response regulator transcription factor [Actinomycetota bacterium]
MRVLLIEDDRELASILAAGLRAESYAVDVAATAADAVRLLSESQFDVACIDLGLPDDDGLALIRRLSTIDGTLVRPRRIIVTTARDSVADRVAGLDAGADDYLVKPFAFAELTARLRALSRRDDQPRAEVIIGSLTIDLAGHHVERSGSPVELTAREFAVLRYLAHRPGEVVSLGELHDHVWDANTDPFSGSARVILSRLRRKLGEPDPITTITGAGYRLEVER